MDSLHIEKKRREEGESKKPQRRANRKNPRGVLSFRIFLMIGGSKNANKVEGNDLKMKKEQRSTIYCVDGKIRSRVSFEDIGYKLRGNGVRYKMGWGCRTRYADATKKVVLAALSSKTPIGGYSQSYCEFQNSIIDNMVDVLTGVFGYD